MFIQIFLRIILNKDKNERVTKFENKKCVNRRRRIKVNGERKC
jgi:hypothetical protein